MNMSYELSGTTTVITRERLMTADAVMVEKWKLQHQSLKVEDCMTSLIISLWLMWRIDTINQRDIFFSIK